MAALSVVICYADRSNISTAIIPMSEQVRGAAVCCWELRCCTRCHSRGGEGTGLSVDAAWVGRPESNASSPLLVCCNSATDPGHPLHSVHIPPHAQFGWEDSQKGVILAMFFLGYLLTQLLGGALRCAARCAA